MAPPGGHEHRQSVGGVVEVPRGYEEYPLGAVDGPVHGRRDAHIPTGPRIGGAVFTKAVESEDVKPKPVWECHVQEEATTDDHGCRPWRPVELPREQTRHQPRQDEGHHHVRQRAPSPSRRAHVGAHPLSVPLRKRTAEQSIREDPMTRGGSGVRDC